jgi:hypothetical protein
MGEAKRRGTFQERRAEALALRKPKFRSKTYESRFRRLIDPLQQRTSS